jgi:hypothetical protein
MIATIAARNAAGSDDHLATISTNSDGIGEDPHGKTAPDSAPPRGGIVCFPGDF